MAQNGEFFAGVVEGFYGKPWTQEERLRLLKWMNVWGLNTYLYAPKDDLNHRTLWQKPYGTKQAEALRTFAKECAAKKVSFIYGLSPGLDIRYSNRSHREILKQRFLQLRTTELSAFALLFDDIPDTLHADDAARFASFASAQADLANEVFLSIRKVAHTARFFFCPTPYCLRMATRKLGGADYLEAIGRELLPEIEIIWTGPEIISETISVAHIRELQTVLRRKPVIWDNLFANDYDHNRFYCGPYSGRPLELRKEVNGIILNPNNEFPLNFVPLRTFSSYVQAGAEWDERAEYLSAMRQWLAEFEPVTQPIPPDDLVLFGDCFYLPHTDGPQAVKFFSLARAAVKDKTHAQEFQSQAKRLREFCQRVTELHDRSLFHALSRRVWELREELDLLERFVAHRSSESFHSDFHLPKTYRGGFVRQLQSLLKQQPDGSFVC